MIVLLLYNNLFLVGRDVTVQGREGGWVGCHGESLTCVVYYCYYYCPATPFFIFYLLLLSPNAICPRGHWTLLEEDIYTTPNEHLLLRAKYQPVFPQWLI